MKYAFISALILSLLTLFTACDAHPADANGGQATTTTPAAAITTTTASPLATTTSVPSASGKRLTADEAKTIALQHAAVQELDTVDWEIELDYEREKTVYEVSFDTREWEFEYEIDAVSGTVLRHQKEPHD